MEGRGAPHVDAVHVRVGAEEQIDLERRPPQRFWQTMANLRNLLRNLLNECQNSRANVHMTAVFLADQAGRPCERGPMQR